MLVMNATLPSRINALVDEAKENGIDVFVGHEYDGPDTWEAIFYRNREDEDYKAISSSELARIIEFRKSH